MNGFSQEVEKVGRYKAAGLYGTTMTEEQRELVRKRVEEVAGWFKGFVTAHRSIPAEAMEGQCFYGNEAKANKLIDEIGSRDDALEVLETLIEMKDRDLSRQ